MSRGRRYETEQHINRQKVIAVIIAIAVVVMFIIILMNVISQRKESQKEYQYFTIYTSNKWGIINNEGEVIIEPSYQEMIVIPSKDKDVFICTYNVNEETGEYETKAINSKNEEILKQYEQIEAIENIDQNGNIWYEEGTIRVKKNQQYGLIDLGGKELLPCEYDDIYALEGMENSLIIKKNGKIGLVNDKGSIIIEPEYRAIKNLGRTYKEGYITVNDQSQYGLVSTTKRQILENKYEEIMQVYLNEYYLVKESGKLKLINESGTTLLENGFDDIKSVTTEGVIIVKKGLYGEIKTTGETLIEPKYEDLIQAKDGKYIAKKDGKYGIIDNVENVMLDFKYEGINYNEKVNLYIAENDDFTTSIIDELYNVKITGILSEINTEKSYIKMWTNDEYKYYNFEGEEKANTEMLAENTIFLSKNNGKYGFIDQKGNIVVDYIYDDATEQNKYGYVAVKKDGLWGSLDKTGKEVIEPKYNLGNYLIVEFIGKWHLGEDLNMNYYCDK